MDKGFDALYLEGGNPISFYSLYDDKKLVIQGLAEFTGAEEVQLGISVRDHVENLTLSIDRVEGELGEVPILLEDTKKGVIHDLTKGDYHFSVSDSDELDSRFILRFEETALSIEQNQLSQPIMIYQRESELVVDTDLGVNRLEIFDVLGRPLEINQKPSGENAFSLQRVPRGSIFLVRVYLDNGQLHTRRLLMK
jgi:hypothetical protein